MDQATQQNAALVEEAAAAAQAMQDQARALAEAVSVFRVNGAQSAALPPARKARELPAQPAPKAVAQRPAAAPVPAKSGASSAPRQALPAGSGGDWEEF